MVKLIIYRGRDDWLLLANVQWDPEMPTLLGLVKKCPDFLFPVSRVKYSETWQCRHVWNQAVQGFQFITPGHKGMEGNSGVPIQLYYYTWTQGNGRQFRGSNPTVLLHLDTREWKAIQGFQSNCIITPGHKGMEGNSGVPIQLYYYTWTQGNGGNSGVPIQLYYYTWTQGNGRQFRGSNPTVLLHLDTREWKAIQGFQSNCIITPGHKGMDISGSPSTVQVDAALHIIIVLMMMIKFEVVILSLEGWAELSKGDERGG